MSTPTVTLDVLHPSARESVTRKPTDQFAKYQVTRVFLVTGLDTGADNQAATMMDRALQVPGIPQLGTLAPGAAGTAGAVAISRTTLAIPQSDNSCYVLVTYENPLPGAPVAFLVSDDTTLTVESAFLHPKDKSQIVMTYQAPNSLVPPTPGNIILPSFPYVQTQNDPNAKPEQYQAHFRYSRPIRKVVITGYVINANLDDYRAAIGSVNDSGWLGYGIGYWRFDEFRADGILFGNIQKVTVAMVSRINENWMSWDNFNSPDLGRRAIISPADTAALMALPYFYGWTSRNGIIIAGLYPLAGFSALFGFGGSGGAAGGAF